MNELTHRERARTATITHQNWCREMFLRLLRDCDCDSAKNRGLNDCNMP